MYPTSRRTWIAIGLLLLLISGCSESNPDQEKPILLLENLQWDVVAGFDPSYKAGIPSSALAGAKKSDSFPMVINRLLELSPGDGLLHSTLQTRFSLDKSQLGSPLGLHFPWIGESFRIYLNGYLVMDEMQLETGPDGSSAELATRKIFRHLTVPLNNAHLNAGENTLVVHFAGYRQPTSIEDNGNHGFMFSGGYELAPLSYLEANHTDTLRIVLSTVYLFFGLYHLVIFSRRRQDSYNLFFGLFCFVLALDSVTGTLQLHRAIAETAWINRIKYFSQSLLIPLFFYFLHRYFHPEERTPLLLRIFGYSLAGTGVLFLIIPFRYTEPLLTIFHFLAIPALLYAIFFIGRIILLRKRDSLLFGISIFILIGSGLWGIVDSELFHTGLHLLPYGFLFCILSLIFILANRFLTVHNESERLNQELTEQKNAFHRFVPTQFLNHLGRSSPVEVMAGDSVLREMTVLFCDIRSFTALAEGSGPEETFSILNGHLQQMEPCIYRHGGFVDKYVGDAILSLFSDDRKSSASQPNSAHRAVSAAIEMAKVARSAENMRPRSSGGNYLPGFGIGINSGSLVLGTVGSPSRIDTTVIGDTVNTCSRMESLTIHYGCPILISGFTRQRLGEGRSFHLRQVDEVYLRGKKQKTAIFEIFDADPPEQLLQKERGLHRFEQAMELYRRGDFADSLKIFQDLQQKCPLDQILPLYVERIKGFLEQGAPFLEKWDGAIPVIGG
ncbi:MAG: adenylate/guanylate cyclase domain-containing protein [Leptospiraceae bacterium]|nr:adenylate/guanylate cyclase domain-containing protein [Leptospiraceae bacterium]